MRGLVAATGHRPEASQARVDRLTEVRDHDQGINVDFLIDRLVQLVRRQHRSVRVADLADCGLGVLDPDDLEGSAVGVVAESDLDAHTDWMLGKANPLREVRLEDQTEGAFSANAVNMCTQIGT